MKPEGSLPRLQQLATCPYSESDQSSLFTSSHFLKIDFNIILPSTPASSKWSFSPFGPLLFPYMLHAPPISLIGSPEKYVVRSTDH